MASALTVAVRSLSPKAKQAMFAASQKDDFARGTWNGCAFNKASYNLGGNVGSVDAAAALFGMTARAVAKFITAWDGYAKTETDPHKATALLREEIEAAGLFSPAQSSRVTKIVTTVEYESTMEKFQESLAAGTVELANEAYDLLMGQLTS